MPERNAKVRRRLAAGKLTLRIRDLRNLGPRTEHLLAEIGIHSVEALRARGALEAYLAVRRAGGVQSLTLLWALVGALEPWPEGRDWREVAKGDSRVALLLAVEGRERVRKDLRQDEAPKRPRRRSPQPAEIWVPGMPFKGPARRSS